MALLQTVRKPKNPVGKFLLLLHALEPARREAAMEQLKEMTLSVEDGLRVLDAARLPYPPSDCEWQDTPAQLIELCCKNPFPQYISKMEQIYPELRSRARAAVLNFLATYEYEAALWSYLRILQRDYRRLRRLPTGSLNTRPRCPRVLFPALLTMTDNKQIAGDIYLLLLDYLAAGMEMDSELGGFRSRILKDIEKIAALVLKRAGSHRFRIPWDDASYLELRHCAGIHLDLAGFIGNEKTIAVLRRMMALRDMRLKMLACISLVRLGQNLDARDARHVAANPEARIWFYEKLSELKRSDLFPDEFHTREAFAESRLVNWLILPTGMGRAPDATELMGVFYEGDEEYFLFRFRCTGGEWAGYGWMAGLVGPFNRWEKPSAVSVIQAFSRWESWESKAPEEHFLSIMGTVHNWGAGRAREIEDE